MIQRTVSGQVIERKPATRGEAKQCISCKAWDDMRTHQCPPTWVARDEFGDDVMNRIGSARKRFYGLFAQDAAEAAAEYLFERGEDDATPITVEVSCVRTATEWRPPGDWVRVTVDVAIEVEFSARPLSLAKRRVGRPRKASI